MKFNEDSRVNIPTILHMTRLGYTYLSLKGQTLDLDTNILPELFTIAIKKINPGIESDDVSRLLEEVKLSLDNENLGQREIMSNIIGLCSLTLFFYCFQVLKHICREC